MHKLRIRLFGPPRVELDETPVEIQRRKVMALLIYLAISGQPHGRDAMAALFWPDYSQQRARAYLRRDLALLNKSLAGEWLLTDRETIELKRGVEFWLDITEFRRLIGAGQRHDHPPEQPCNECMGLLTDAVELYTDDFLAGFTLRDSPEFDDWQFFQAESLRQELASVLDRLVQGHVDRGEYEAAIPHARRWVALDPLHEPAQRQLMGLYNHAGQSSAALRQYEEYFNLLEEEFGVPPEEETATLYEAIKAGRILGQYLKTEGKKHQGMNARQPDVKAQSATPVPTLADPALSIEQVAPHNNLPVQATPFIGRERELSEIRQLLLEETACRLLTLVGSGGIGKTRLAIEAAQRFIDDPSGLDRFTHGILFVSLVAVSEPGGMASAIAEASNLNVYSHSPLRQQLLDYLRDKQKLILLDDFEHLMDGVDLVVDILATAPGIKMIVTSREALSLQEAWYYSITGLPFPESDVTAEIPISDYDAVRLFEQNARRARIGFNLADDQAHVVRICRLVDGVPLAIELAAAWLKVLTAEDVVNEIERSLDILTTRHQNVPHRHRSMRVVLEQSWTLLPEDEREVLKKLSVFLGGFRQNAAQQIADASLFMLASLVEKSLLRRDASGRYQIHELLRQFADEKLRETVGQKEQVQVEHGRYYAEFLQQRERELEQGEQQVALEEISEEMENIRSSWRWTTSESGNDSDKIEIVDKASGSLFHFYYMGSWFEEGAEAFGRAATFLNGADEKQVQIIGGKILAKQGWLAFNMGQHNQGKALLKRSLALLRSLDAQTDMVFSLNYLGAVTRHLGQYDLAQQHLQESLAICRKSGDQYSLTVALNILGQVAYLQGEYDEAKWFCQESLTVKRQIGDRWGMTFSLTYLGTVAKALGEYEEAKRLFQESLSISKSIGDRRGLATSLNNVGDALAALREYEEAEKLYGESLTIFQRIGNQLGIITSLTNLGNLYCSLGSYQQARQQFQNALDLALANRVMPKVLEVFAGMAELWLKEENRKQAIEILSLVVDHPASSKENQDRAVRLLSELAPVRPDETMILSQEDQHDKLVDAMIKKIML